MKAIIFTATDHIYANKIVKELLQSKELKVISIVESTRIHPKLSNWQCLIRYFRVSGPEYVAYQFIKVLYFKAGSFLYNIYGLKQINHTLFPYRILAKKNNIPIIKTNNINDEKFIHFLSKKKADIFISILFNQIFETKILAVPSLGTINLHPSMLPSYRGVSPTFWVLAKGEKSTGVTIHRITDNRIDQGVILAQKLVPILDSDSEHSLYWRCANFSLPLFNKVFISMKKNQTEKRSALKNINTSYYSLPTKEAIKEFKSRNRKFYTWKELFYER